jgi:hypothetical protein
MRCLLQRPRQRLLLPLGLGADVKKLCVESLNMLSEHRHLLLLRGRRLVLLVLRGRRLVLVLVLRGWRLVLVLVLRGWRLVGVLHVCVRRLLLLLLETQVQGHV